MGETPFHFDNLSYLVWQLNVFFAADPLVFVAGNMFLYYVEGQRNRHLSPDVFVVRGIPKHRFPRRRRYLLWEEGKGPDVVIEVTSASTREEDMDDKMRIYREEIHVPEYFLFDPLGEYLEPRLQGYRLIGDQYQPIARVEGRLPSDVLGLHLEPVDDLLRLYDPSAGRWLPTPSEEREARLQAEVERQRIEIERQRVEAERQRAEAERLQAEAERQREVDARRQAETENERLRREVEELRRRLGPTPES
jgi:hypothetical protein